MNSKEFTMEFLHCICCPPVIEEATYALLKQDEIIHLFIFGETPNFYKISLDLDLNLPMLAKFEFDTKAAAEQTRKRLFSILADYKIAGKPEWLKCSSEEMNKAIHILGL